MDSLNFEWNSHTWTAPDGKEVAYKCAIITELFPLLNHDWNWSGNGDVWMEATQWPRYTKVTLVRTTTMGGGDFEGTDEFIEHIQLATYPNATFWADVMRDKADLQARALRILG